MIQSDGDFPNFVMDSIGKDARNCRDSLTSQVDLDAQL